MLSQIKLPTPSFKPPKYLDEFKSFAIKGNVIDLAVGVIIGASFGKVVTSIVTDIITPPISVVLGGVDFSNLFITLSKGDYATLDAAKAAGAITINYGLFLNTVLDFVIVAAVVFLLVKTVSRIRREPVPPPPDTRECPRCFTSVKNRATRCPACTSEIPAAA